MENEILPTLPQHVGIQRKQATPFRFSPHVGVMLETPSPPRSEDLQNGAHVFQPQLLFPAAPAMCAPLAALIGFLPLLATFAEDLAAGAAVIR